jgi:syntaxin 5
VDNLKNRLMTATKEFKEVLTMRTEVIWNLLFNTRGSSIFCNWIIAIVIYCLCFEFSVYVQNLKVHDNRRQLFSSTASKDSSNPFVRQRPLASRTAAMHHRLLPRHGPMVLYPHPSYLPGTSYRICCY